MPATAGEGKDSRHRVVPKDERRRRSSRCLIPVARRCARTPRARRCPGAVYYLCPKHLETAHEYIVFHGLRKAKASVSGGFRVPWQKLSGLLGVRSARSILARSTMTYAADALVYLVVYLGRGTKPLLSSTKTPGANAPRSELCSS